MEKKVEETFTFNGREYHAGEVLINREEGVVAVLSHIVHTHIDSPLPFLIRDIDNYAPAIFCAYIAQNDPGERVILPFKPERGVGKMDEFELATEEEIAKFESVLLSEGHISYKYPEISFEYIPTYGDIVVAWDGDDQLSAVVGVVIGSEDYDGGAHAKLNDGRTYDHAFPLNDMDEYIDIVSPLKDRQDNE